MLISKKAAMTLKVTELMVIFVSLGAIFATEPWRTTCMWILLVIRAAVGLTAIAIIISDWQQKNGGENKEENEK